MECNDGESNDKKSEPKADEAKNAVRRVCDFDTDLSRELKENENLHEEGDIACAEEPNDFDEAEAEYFTEDEDVRPENAFNFAKGCFLCGVINKTPMCRVQESATIRKIVDILSSGMLDKRFVAAKERFLQLNPKALEPLLYHTKCYKLFIKKRLNQSKTDQNQLLFAEICSQLEANKECNVDVHSMWLKHDCQKKWSWKYLLEKLRGKYGTSIHVKEHFAFVESAARPLIRQLEQLMLEDPSGKISSLVMQLAAKTVVIVSLKFLVIK